MVNSKPSFHSETLAVLSQKIQDALNAQINLELLSSYHYLAMAAHFESESLPGMAALAQIIEHAGKKMPAYRLMINTRGT